MQFDGTINLGHILTVITFVGVMLGGWYAMRTQLELLNSRVQNLNEKANGLAQELAKQTEILTRLGQQETELRDLRAQVQRIQGVFQAVLTK